MSTSPSWFDQDKFSRLVKKVGPKTTAAGQSSAKIPSKPLLREALLAPGTKEPEIETRGSLLPPQAQLPIDEKAPEPEAKKPEPTAPVSETPLPSEEAKAPVEIKAPAQVRRAPVTPPSESKRLTSRLPKVDRFTPPPKIKSDDEPGLEPTIAEEAPPIPPPIHFETGAPFEDEVEEVEEPQATEEIAEETVEDSPVAEEVAGEEEEVPALPKTPPPLRSPASAQRMMTSQPLSLGKRADAAPSPVQDEPKVEPIRAPEPAPSSAIKAPPLPGGVSSGKLPQRTTPLPALKSLFQYEIPGGQGVIPGKPAASEPPPLKAPLPTFSFPKPVAKTPTETLPPTPDEEEDIPVFSGSSEAAHLAGAAELEEEELTPESLAEQWGQADNLKEELERITQERDDALAAKETLEKQLAELRDKPAAATEKPVADTAEIEFLTRERDQIRGEYIKLREDFEKMKQDNLHAKAEPPPLPVAPDPELEKKIEKLQSDLSQKDQELRATKLQLRDVPKGPSPEVQKELEKLREDIASKDRELDLVKAQLKDIPEPGNPDAEKEVEKLRKDIEDKNRELESKGRDLDLVKAQLKDSSETEKEIEKLRKELEDKNRELESKGRELDLVKAQLNDIPEPGNPEAEKEVEKLKGDLAEKEREMVALKLAAGQTDVAMDKLKEEIIGVRNEVKKAQNEASVAQRGLALSQKALQETREALREASEHSGKK
jgi:hypothetical protein